MNKIQITILTLGLLLFLLMALFPPWVNLNIADLSTDPHGYHWFLSPPNNENEIGPDPMIDVSKFYSQLLVLILLSVSGFLLAGRK